MYQPAGCKRREAEGWRVNDEEGDGEGTPAAKRPGDHTGFRFPEDVPLQAPA